MSTGFKVYDLDKDTVENYDTAETDNKNPELCIL